MYLPLDTFWRSVHSIRVVMRVTARSVTSTRTQPFVEYGSSGQSIIRKRLRGIHMELTEPPCKVGDIDINVDVDSALRWVW
jgi:hypothetical protein